MALMREQIGADGTVALVTLLRHSQEEVLQAPDAVNARIDGTLRYAITFCPSLLGLVAAAATGLLPLGR